MSSPLDKWEAWATHAVCSEVIEHVDSPSELLRNARPYMTAGCQLIVTAPGPMSAFDKHIGHRKHWRPHEIDILFQDAGYSPISVSSVGFPFFNLYRCLVILRGKKLIEDMNAESFGTISLAARAVMTMFGRLIRPNLNSSHWGWQMLDPAIVYPRLIGVGLEDRETALLVTRQQSGQVSNIRQAANAILEWVYVSELLKLPETINTNSSSVFPDPGSNH